MLEPSRPSVVRLQTAAGRPDKNRCSALAVPSAASLPEYVFLTSNPPLPFSLVVSITMCMRNAVTAVGSVCVRHAGQVPLNSEQHLVRRAVQTRDVQRASQIGHEHPIAGNIERESNSFHQMGEH